MKNKVTLYIAEHNVTGLKYFGKTRLYFTEEDLQKNYHGSGVYWKNHLKKHGDNVTMKIYGIYSLDENSDNYVKPIALKFSEDNNIVEDYDNWANQTQEDGLDGWGTERTNEIREKISKSKKELVLFEGELITKAKLSSITRLKNEKLNPEKTKEMKLKMSLKLKKTINTGGGESIAAKRGKLIRANRNKIDEFGISNADKIRQKSQETMNIEFFKDGEKTSINKERNKKTSITLSKEYINENGEKTSIAKENSKKASKKFLKEFILDGEVVNGYILRGRKADKTKKKNGTYKKAYLKRVSNFEAKSNPDKKKGLWNRDKAIKTLNETKVNGMTLEEMRIKKITETKNKTSIKFNIIKEGKIIYERVNRKFVNALSQTLLKSSKEKPLGFSTRSKKALASIGKENLIGCYVETI